MPDKPEIIPVVDHPRIKKLLTFETIATIRGKAPDWVKCPDLISRLNPGIILTDIAMPYLNGLEAVEKALKMNSTGILRMNHLSGWFQCHGENSERLKLDKRYNKAPDPARQGFAGSFLSFPAQHQFYALNLAEKEKKHRHVEASY